MPTGCRHVAVFFMAALTLSGFAEAAAWSFACADDNNLYQCILKGGARPPRHDSPGEAIGTAPDGSAVLILADGYPTCGIL